MTLSHVSPSQIDTYSDCARKWYFQSVLGIKSPPHPSAELGTQVHTALEDYLLHGKEPDDSKVGRIARAGLPWARRDSGPPVEVELDIAAHGGAPLTLAGVKVAGRIDLVDRYHRPLLIQDWKTTTDFKWAKTADQLRTNTQAVIYSRFAVEAFAVDRVRFQHVVLLTTGQPEAQETYVDLTREAIVRAFDALIPKVERMKADASLSRPQDVKPTLTACAKYGGCFFRDRCRSFGEGLRGSVHAASPMQETPPTAEDTMNPAIAALQKLKEQKAAGTTAPPTPAAPPTAPAGAAPGAIVPPDAPADLPAHRTEWTGEAKHSFEERAGIREFDGKQPRLVAEAAAEREVRANAKTRKSAKKDDPLPFHATDLPVEDSSASAARPRQTAEVNAAPVADAPPAPPVKEMRIEVKPPPLPSPTLTLYIDCYPQRGVADVVPLEDLIVGFQENVAKQAGVALYSLVEYGKGPALVAAKLAEEIPSGVVYVNSRLPCSNACLEVLLPRANVVVRGH